MIEPQEFQPCDSMYMCSNSEVYPFRYVMIDLTTWEFNQLMVCYDTIIL